MAAGPLHLIVEGERGRARSNDPFQAPLVAAFIGRTERGPLDEPVAVGDFEQFRRVFGAHRSFGFVADAVRHYFLHGGAAAVVVRVANRATRARIDVPARGQTLRLQALDPGSREFLRVSVDYDGCEGQRFNLVVQRVAAPGSHAIEDQELYHGLSMKAADERFVVDALQDSKLIRLAGPLPTHRPDATRSAHPGLPIPYVELTVPGSDGDELTDYDLIGSNTEGTGLFALDRVPRFDFLCIPPPPRRDLGTTTFVAAERYCDRRRALLIWDPPWAWQSVDAALMTMRSCPPIGANAMGYFPRVIALEELERFPSGLPACGVVAGFLASRPPWHADTPAATLTRGLRPSLQLDAAQARRLRGVGINAMRRHDPGSQAFEGDVTLAGASAPLVRRSIGKRRIVLFVLDTVEQWARRETGVEDRRAAVERLAWRTGRLLATLHGRGALVGSRPSEGFFVHVGEGADGGALRLGLALEQPGTFLVYEVRLESGGGRAERVRGSLAGRLTG